MAIADTNTYLAEIIEVMKTHWPQNRTVNIVCHGHSVPSGYIATPLVDAFNAYPHLLHRALKHRFPFAVINVIITAIGGENSEQGAKRFENQVLCHRPDVLTIDYGLNDRGIGRERAQTAWRSMIEAALARKVKVLLMTPTADRTRMEGYQGDDRPKLPEQAEQIRRMAEEYGVGLVDSLAAFDRYQREEGALWDLLGWINHPNRKGHELVARELMRWFPVV